MIIFFDVDDTLYDRCQPFAAAAREFFGRTIAHSRQAYLCCTSRGNEVFLPSQRGEISMEEMYIYRWTKGFFDVGIRISPAEALSFQKIYRRKQDDITLSREMQDILRYCASHADRIGIITNGPSDTQWNKITRLELAQYINRDSIIVSGDVGVDKPDTAIFRLAQELSNAVPEDMIFVGDSPENDIAPAASLGWHTIWHNCNQAPIPDRLHPDAISTTEAELADCIRKLL